MNIFKSTIASVTVVSLALSMATGTLSSSIPEDIINNTAIVAEAAEVNTFSPSLAPQCCTLVLVANASATAGNSRYINQWGLKDRQLKNASCFESALANTLYYASNGAVKIPVSDIRYICDHSGAWTANEGTWRDPMIKYLDNKGYDDKYRFKFVDKGTYTNVKDKDLKSFLSSGRENVCIAHVPGHFIALVDYNAKTNKYLVIESVVYTGKNGRNLPAYGWVEAEKLNKGKSKVDWISKIRYNKKNPTKEKSSDKGTVKTSYFKAVTVKNKSIVDALKKIGADSSYAYREKVYNANGLKKTLGVFRGDAKQNAKLYSLISCGKLIKP